jgi:transcriptional regulator with XRE-family HTH domain
MNFLMTSIRNFMTDGIKALIYYEHMQIRGDRIDERLKAMGKSQDWLAKETGLSQPSIALYIRNKVKRPKRVREMAAALLTTQEYLLGETDDPCLPAPPPNIPARVLAAFEALKGVEFTKEEVAGLIWQLELIRRSHNPDNSDNPDSEPPQK